MSHQRRERKRKYRKRLTQQIAINCRIVGTFCASLGVLFLHHGKEPGVDEAAYNAGA